MQSGQGQRVGYPEPSPDRGLEVQETDVKLVDRGGGVLAGGGHGQGEVSEPLCRLRAGLCEHTFPFLSIGEAESAESHRNIGSAGWSLPTDFRESVGPARSIGANSSVTDISQPTRLRSCVGHAD